MTLWNYEEIKNQVLESWEVLKDHNYPEDILDSLADSCVPVYQNDTIREWQEMPSEYDNIWQEQGLPSEKVSEITIIGLMKIDLYYFYSDQLATAYREILEFEKENA